MIFGLTWEKLLLIGLLAAIIVGPDRLPKVAESLARLTHRGGQLVKNARERLREEVGPEIDEMDWRKLDPRQYDPRRIIRDALLDEPTVVAPVVAAATERPDALVFEPGSPPPYDDEAT